MIKKLALVSITVVHKNYQETELNSIFAGQFDFCSAYPQHI